MVHHLPRSPPQSAAAAAPGCAPRMICCCILDWSRCRAKVAKGAQEDEQIFAVARRPSTAAPRTTARAPGQSGRHWPKWPGSEPPATSYVCEESIWGPECGERAAHVQPCDCRCHVRNGATTGSSVCTDNHTTSVAAAVARGAARTEVARVPPGSPAAFADGVTEV
eukprot:4452529-Prymnesium_polylepis.1